MIFRPLMFGLQDNNFFRIRLIINVIFCLNFWLDFIVIKETVKLMKYRNIAKWDSPENSKSLLFFAQLMEELLFDFSLDTYKPSAMNTSLLCEEALEVIAEIDNGNIKKPNLQHVLSELCENLSKDETAKSLLKMELSAINSVLLDIKKSSSDKKIVVELIQRQIYLKKYKKRNEELLAEAIMKSYSFSIIRALTRSYATTLINIGYSSEYIYQYCQKFFYYSKDRIVGNQAISDFINNFSGEPNEYKVIYRGSELYRLIEESCHGFKISILDDISEIKHDLSGLKFNLCGGEVYICINEIKARDIKSAKEKADEKLELLGTLFTLFHHKERPDFLAESLIINITENMVNKSREAVNAMHKCVDLRTKEASNKMNRFISEFSLEKISFQKFTRSAELHSLALNSDSKENQMINLWIALESIIPANVEENSLSNIEHIISSVIPFLNIIYFQRLITRFSRDLLNWNKYLIVKTIRDIDGKKVVEKVIKLLALPEYADKREKLKNEFKDFHLLSDRFEYFCFIFSSPSNVLNALENHTKRVEWQIRRIYRARNLIVHSGKTPSYTEILIENIHDYLDSIMSAIIRLATKPKTISSVEQGFKYIELSYTSYLKELGEKDAVFNSDNLITIFDKESI
jgi:hypothetical protein